MANLVFHFRLLPAKGKWLRNFIFYFTFCQRLRTKKFHFWFLLPAKGRKLSLTHEFPLYLSFKKFDFDFDLPLQASLNLWKCPRMYKRHNLCLRYRYRVSQKKIVPLRKCPYLSWNLISWLDFLDLESLYDLWKESKRMSRSSGYFAFFMSRLHF